MKKSAKPLIAILLVMLLIITALVLMIIGTRFKYEELIREKVQVEKQLRIEQTKKTNLFADYQMVSSQSVIVQAARQDLGLIQSHESFTKISLDKKEIERINKMLREKYD